MVILTRTVRFSPTPEGSPSLKGEASNGFAGWPRAAGLVRHDEVHVECRGLVDPQTAYLIDIKDVDRAVLTAMQPRVSAAFWASPADANPMQVLRDCVNDLNQRLGGMLHRVRWQITPTYSVSMEAHAMHLAQLRQRFDFAASHRLHNPSLSDEENRSLYGKCNNPRGHGHNYQFEPCIEVAAGEGAPAFTLEMLETLAKRAILDRFDHRHLNEDTEEFRQPGGLNPSVENIAKVFFDLLGTELARMKLPGTLRHVTVWETDRTCATFPG